MKKIIIVTDHSLYKKEGAAYNRVLCYRKALGSNYQLYCLYLNHFTGKIPPTVKYDNQSMIGFTSSEIKESFLYRNLLKFFDWSKPNKLVDYILLNYSPNDVVYIYASGLPLIASVLLRLRKVKFKIVVEKNELEYGKVLNTSTMYKGLDVLALLLFPFRLINAFITDMMAFYSHTLLVISSSIYCLYRWHGNRVIIPVLVDTAKYKPTYRYVEEPIKMIYIGTVTRRKDAIMVVLEAINMIKDDLDGKLELHILGKASKEFKKTLSKFICQNQLKSIIKLLPSVKAHVVPDILPLYDIGLLIREKNIQTKYGFATKLGEYLASGLPVIANDISDNLLYLKDSFNSIIIEDVNALSLNRVFLSLLKDKERINKMKRNAVHTAREGLDLQNFSKDLKKVFSN